MSYSLHKIYYYNYFPCTLEHDSNFVQGAVDIYASPNVFVRRSTFSGNGFATVFKSELYRGQAGGLSIGELILHHLHHCPYSVTVSWHYLNILEGKFKGQFTTIIMCVLVLHCVSRVLMLIAMQCNTSIESDSFFFVFFTLRLQVCLQKLIFQLRI